MPTWYRPHRLSEMIPKISVCRVGFCIAHPETSDPCWSELLITAQTRPIASANYGVIERGIGFSAQPGLIWVCCPVVRWNREILVDFCFGCFVGVVVFFFGH